MHPVYAISRLPLSDYLSRLVRCLQRRHNRAIKLVLELIQLKVHLSLICQKHAVYTPLRGVEVVYPGLLLHAVEVPLQRAVVVLEDRAEGLLAKGLVDGEFDEEDAELEDESLGGGYLAERAGGGCG